MSDEGSKNDSTHRTPPVFATLLVALTTLAFAVFSAERLAPTWDEGDAFFRAERVSEWLNALWLGPATYQERDFVAKAPEGSQRRELRRYFATLPSRRALFSPETLEIGFQHAIYREGHPAGYTLTIAVGSTIAEKLGVPSCFSEKTALRFGGLLLFTAAIAAVFWRVSRSFGLLFGLGAVVGVVSSPHVFCHSMIAGGDSLLISSWLLAWSFFIPARKSVWGAIAWGCALGVSFSAKFSGFLLVAPFLAVVCLELLFDRSFRREAPRVLSRLTLGLVVGAIVFMVVDPPLWHDPIRGLGTFWTLNTQRVGFNIPTFFLGQYYNLDRPLPWWNGFFWIAATTPVFLTALALFQVASTGRQRLKSSVPADENVDDPRGLLTATALALGLALPIVRAFPGVPVHDGVRLIVASAAFWGLLGGLGACSAASFVARSLHRRSALVRAGIAALLLAPGCVDLLRSAPLYLSFYSAPVGGVVGAAKLGLEPTYYWDSFDADVAAALRELAQRAREEGRPDAILFSEFSSQTLDFYRRWNVLGPSTLATISSQTASRDPRDYGFFVVQNRPSVLSEYDVAVMKSAKPLFSKTIGNPLPNPFCHDRENIAVLKVYDMRGLVDDE